MNDKKALIYKRFLSLVRKVKGVSKNFVSYSRLDSANRLMRMPVKYLTNEFAFSYDPIGWNYFHALVAEYSINPTIELENTTFYRFFQHDQVKASCYFNDVLFLHNPSKRTAQNGYDFYFDINPWGGWYKKDSVVGGIPWGHHYDRIEGKMTRDMWGGFNRNIWYHPGDIHPLQLEWQKTINLYNSINRGYHPSFFSPQPPEVALLVRKDGEMRAVVVDGQHRVSILSYLGYREIVVSLAAQYDSIGLILETEADQWYYVRNGHCSREQALMIFHAFFSLNGRERIKYLGLPSVY